LALAALPFAALAVPAQAQVAGDKIPNAYICVFKAGAVGRGQAEAEARGAVQAHGGQIGHVYRNTIRGFSANMPAVAIERMQAANPNIAYCEQDQIMATPPIRIEARPGGGGGTPPPQETPWGIVRVGGPATGTFNTAWVIDTGIVQSHPDLNVDTARSRSFLGGTTLPWDENGHGTHVAGTIAALNNTIGVVGVAAGAPVVAVRVLNRRGSGTNSGVIAGVDYVGQVGQAGDVANMSLGGGISQALDDAVIAASNVRGVKFALAAGNESTNAMNRSPARAEGANLFTVSAFAQGDTWASFSNYGNPPIEYAEPGVAIKSTWLSGGYNTISGTSMATPHLAGILLTRATPANGGTVSGDPAAPADTIGTR
jgi:subtilisin family serine protease